MASTSKPVVEAVRAVALSVASGLVVAIILRNYDAKKSKQAAQAEKEKQEP